MPNAPQDDYVLTPEQARAMVDNPAAWADWLADFVRARIPPDWATVQTTTEAGIATTGYGVLLTNVDSGIEMKIELDADFRVHVDVSATKPIGKPWVPFVRYALKGLCVEMGLSLAI